MLPNRHTHSHCTMKTCIVCGFVFLFQWSRHMIVLLVWKSTIILCFSLILFHSSVSLSKQFNLMSFSIHALKYFRNICRILCELEKQSHIFTLDCWPLSEKCKTNIHFSLPWCLRENVQLKFFVERKYKVNENRLQTTDIFGIL